MTPDLERSTTRSGKYYQTKQEGDISVYSPIREATMQSPPGTPLSNQHRSNKFPMPPPTLEDDMATHMKLSNFKGVGDEDMDQFWFVTGSVWAA